MNTFKTAFLLTALTLLFLFIGGAVGGQNGMFVALAFAGVMNFVSYFWSDKIVLAMYRAQPLTPDANPEIYRRVAPIVERLAMRRNIPMPRLYVIPTDTPNAFATGRNPKHAAVAVTAGILQILGDSELEGVLAHELGHVLNRDILISSVAAMIAGAITVLARMGEFAMIFGGYGRDRDDDRSGGLGGLLMLIVAPIAALLIQAAISRSREYAADAAGADMTGNPYGLANALEKLETGNKRLPMNASPATAHLFIVKPFSGGGIMELFSTHPPIDKRIARLLGRS
ncbi:MAG: zinc metalloprotease HtpX [Acidobacteria bacterium]|nr:zinc metalloprotease HtpX [Acidobacteriota bacterium]